MEFPIRKFGLVFRLVEERDAAFILGLRTNKELAQFLSPTINDLEKQISWIRNYKVREAKGMEYYLIYGMDEIDPCGVIRLYDISDDAFTSGSWIIRPGCDEFVAASSDLFAMMLGFEVLNMEKCVFDTRKANKKVVRYHRMFAEETGEDDENYYFEIDRAHYQYKKRFLSKIIGDK